jgi:aspartate aminotransferase
MTPSELRRAERIGNVRISDIVRVSEATRRRRAQGHDVINLGIGEPDFSTPDHVNEAAIKAIHDGDTHYPPIAGKPLLREAVASLYEGAATENTLVSSGSKYTILNCFMATINDGDEVVLPAPYWISYADIVTICGGVPVNLPARPEDHFQLNIDDLRDAITDRTRWILINSPSNPSGAVMPPGIMAALGKVMEDHPNCWLMSDEIYQHLVYDAEFTSAYDHLPHLRDRLLVINGVSKAYAMTGWRVGFGIGPAPLIEAMTTAQAQGTSGTCTIAQAAALAALEGPQDLLTERCASLRARRDLVLSYLDQIDKIFTPTPQGAFYTFSSWTALEGRAAPSGQVLKTDRDFCEYLLDAADVAVVPGSGFAAPGHFRISYACSTEDLNTALGRIRNAVNAISVA